MKSYDEKIGKWIIDTDPGTDDAFAIILALNFVKQHLLALSITGGNVKLDQCFLNAKKVCVLNGKEHAPVYKGCKLNLSCITHTAEEFHGKDGLFDIEKFINYDLNYDNEIYSSYLNQQYPILEQCSPLKIIELCYKYDNVNLLTIGPLTNIAAAFMIDPNIVNRLNKIIVMGGSFSNRGNCVPCAEFNFAADFISAKVVFDNFENIIVFPWETAELHQLEMKSLDEHWIDNEKCHFCKEIMIKKADIEGGIFADYGAAVCAFFPESIKTLKEYNAEIIIDSSSELNGALIINVN